MCHLAQHVGYQGSGVGVEREYRRYRFELVETLGEFGKRTCAAVDKLSSECDGVVSDESFGVGVVVVELPAVWYMWRNESQIALGEICNGIAHYAFAFAASYIRQFPCVLLVQWKLFGRLHSFVIEVIQVHILL